MERHYHIGQEASLGTFHERYDMIPPTPSPIFSLFVSTLSLLSPFSLFCFTSLCLSHDIGFCFISNGSGSLFQSLFGLSSFLLQVTVHTGVSVQRRDRCIGMQSGTQLFLIYNCQVPHDPCLGGYFHTGVSVQRRDRCTGMQ